MQGIKRQGLDERPKTKNRPQGKRQLGTTNSVGWISPMQYKPPQPRSNTSRKAQSNAIRPHSGTVARSTTRFVSSANERKSLKQRSLVSASTNSLRSLSVSGLGTLSKPIKLATRPQSSLGFQRKWSANFVSTSNGLTPPQGFDLASYVKQSGSAKGIIIGQNGKPTMDEYFDAYLSQCEEQLCRESPDTNSELEESSIDICEDVSVKRNAKRDEVTPLCWEDQVTQSSPKCIRLAISKPQENSLREAATLQNLKNDLKVKLTLDDHCLLDTTYVRDLQDLKSDFKTEVNTNKQVHGNGSLSHYHILEILFYNKNQLSQQELEKQTYDIFIAKFTSDRHNSLSSHNGGSAVESFTNLTARRVLRRVSVITVHLMRQSSVFQTELGLLMNELSSVTVLYGKPRLLLFSVKLTDTAPNLTDPVSPQKSTHFQEALQQQLVKTRAEERSPYLHAPVVLERFFHKRSSYCNQEEDEDRTDIAVISTYLPELKLVENDDQQCAPDSMSSRDLLHSPSTQRPPPNTPVSDEHQPSILHCPANCTNKMPRVIVVPFGKDKTHKRNSPRYMQQTVPLRYSSKEVVSPVPDEALDIMSELTDYTKEDSDQPFSTIANSWIGQYVQTSS